ncbi:hypothetical protein [Tamlana crocina]|uniref:DUF4129 domain-containing protein n=1 Tax=Tamlana crocina TaxID=393006 RepID=A0ABX1DDM0_9FLAO|nr:hypothetical protein [Tamlana crocina]NJX16449.1 hypothetical protein [Tamlana crocina]
MKNPKIHIIPFVLLMCFLFQSSLALSFSEVPQNIRQFDDDFKERYSGNKYNYEGHDIVGETPMGSGNYEDYKKNDKIKSKEDNNEGFLSMDLRPISWLFYIAIIGAVIFLAYILINEGSSGLFSRNHHRNIGKHEDITAENIEQSDIDTFILNAEKSGDYRLAIRYYYLLVLKHLSLKNYIKVEEDKTNSEYLNEIIDKPFNKNFEYTAYLYNYIWYGEFAINQQQYQTAKTHFSTLLKQVG